MKNTFKKALLATSIASIAGMSHAADNVIAGALTVSLEGSNGSTVIAAPNAVITMGAEYTVNDTITITVSGAEFDITASQNATLTYADASGGDNSGTMTLGLLSVNATQAKFRITELEANSGDGTTIDDTVTLAGLDFTTDSVLGGAGTVTLNYSAKTNIGDDLDTAGTPTATAATVQEQFSSAVNTELDQTIDVEASRQQFIGAATTDVLAVTITEAAAATYDATYTGAVHTITGDFSWIDTDGSGALNGTELADATGAVGGDDDAFAFALNDTMTELTVTATDGGNDTAESHTLTFTVAGQADGNPAINAGSYSVSTTVNYNDQGGAATKVLATNADAGEWNLNGSQVRVPYMVVNNSRFGIIANITNHGNQTGDIVLDVWNEAGTRLTPVGGSVVGSSTPGSIVSVASDLNTILSDAGIDLANTTKFSFQITTNVPENDIFVYAAYTDNTTAERAIVNTDAKVQVKGANVD